MNKMTDNNERYNEEVAYPKVDWIIMNDFKQKVHVLPRTTKENKRFQHQHFGKRGISVTLLLSSEDALPVNNDRSPSKQLPQ